MLDKIEFKIKTVTRVEEGDYIKIKGTVQQEAIPIINIYASNMGASKYINS